MLWNGLSATKNVKILNTRDKLHCQMQALSFLLLLDTKSTSLSISKTSIYTEDAITEFESSCGATTKDDATFLLKEIHMLFNRYNPVGEDCKRDGSKQSEMSGLFVISEMVLIITKMLCKGGHHDLATSFISEFESKFRDWAEYHCTAAALGRWAIKIHSSMKTNGETSHAMTECARALRSLSSELRDREAHSVLEGCRLIVWAVESGHSNRKELSGPVLLAWFSFLEEHQELILRTLNKACIITGQEIYLLSAIAG